MEIGEKRTQMLNTKVKDVLKLVGHNKVVSVTGQQMQRCGSSYPCCGHGGALIVLESGEELRVPADSVEIGALQKALAPREASHFAEYVTNWEYKE